MNNHRFRAVFRALQILLALIPVLFGILALLNDASTFKEGVQTIAQPLITLQSDKAQAWRGLPASWAPYVYAGMFIFEFIVGLLALIGVIGMLRNFTKAAIEFEKSKHWVYLACIWGTIVWGLGFFEGAGDWFLAWTSSNGGLSGLQQGALMYVTMLFFVFFYLKFSRESDMPA
jgi:predicted small integral membrane protein